MYIPLAESSELEILPFQTALEQSKIQSHIEYDVRDWLYVPNSFLPYRYILGTVGENPLICVGINPSTAAPNNLDNTLKSVERIAKHNGFDSFIMFNVYAQRATNPKTMDRELNERLHFENMKAFEYILNIYINSTPAVWAAWGNIIEMRPYLKKCLLDMLMISKKYGAKWYSCGSISKKGHPHHPLYLKKDTPLDLFNAEEYLNILV